MLNRLYDALQLANLYQLVPPSGSGLGVARLKNFHLEGVDLPISVTLNLKRDDDTPAVDLRLPFGNPLLRGDEHPLREVCADLLKVTDAGNHAVLVGSSGCGKTAAAFLLCEQRFSLYTEVPGVRLAAKWGYLVTLLRSSSKDYEELLRKAQLEFLARALLLALTFGRMSTIGEVLTPGNWLLHMLNGTTDAVESIRGALSQFHINSDQVSQIFREIAVVIGGTPVAIMDECHRLAGGEDMMYNFMGEAIDPLQAIVVAVASFGLPTVWIGTRVSIEQAASAASGVMKHENQAQSVYVLGKYPFLQGGRWPGEEQPDHHAPSTVLAALHSCLDLSGLDDVFLEKISYRLQGRSRSVASFLELLVNQVLVEEEADGSVGGVNKETAMDRALELLEVSRRTSIHDELNRWFALPRSVTVHLTDDLLTLWRALLMDDDKKIPKIAQLTSFVCATEVLTPRRDGFTTGGVMRGGTSVTFRVDTDEPWLHSALHSFMVHRPFWRNGKGVSALLGLAVAEMIRSPLNGGRGELFDFVVALRMMSLCAIAEANPAPPSNVEEADATLVCLQPFLRTFSDYELPEECRSAQFMLTKCVSGGGALLTWLEDFFSGKMGASETIVLPDNLAGADVVFGAMTPSGRRVVVSIACTWSDGGVSAAKVTDQKRKVFIAHQYKRDGRTGAEEEKDQLSAGEEEEGQLTASSVARLDSIFQKYSVVNVPVMVELPRRIGRTECFPGNLDSVQLRANSRDERAANRSRRPEGVPVIVVDKDNIQRFLGTDDIVC